MLTASLLGPLRFTFSKDIRHIVRHSSICCPPPDRIFCPSNMAGLASPYNPALDENFRMHRGVLLIPNDPNYRTPIIMHHHPHRCRCEARSMDLSIPKQGPSILRRTGPRPARTKSQSAIIDAYCIIGDIESNRSGVPSQLLNVLLASIGHATESPALAPASALAASPSLSISTTGNGLMQVACLTEQIPHHSRIRTFVEVYPSPH